MEKVFNDHKMKERRQLLRRNMPSAEWALWQYLKHSALEGVKFRRQTSIGSFVVDFYAPSKKLVIEIDGDSHFSPEAQEYDADRQTAIESLGTRFLRFTNDDIFEDMEGVLEKIRFVVSTPPPTTPQRGGVSSGEPSPEKPLLTKEGPGVVGRKKI